MKILRWLILLGFSLIPLSADSYVLSNDFLNQRSIDFIQKISSELYEKTGVSLYVACIDFLEGEGKDVRQTYKQSILKNLKAPYGVIFFIKSHKKIDVIVEPKIDSIDTQAIVSKYMVPILVQDKKLSNATISASILNGYAQLADEIATHFHQELPENIIVDKSGAKNFLHYAFLAMMGITFLLIAGIYLFGRKRK